MDFVRDHFVAILVAIIVFLLFLYPGNCTKEVANVLSRQNDTAFVNTVLSFIKKTDTTLNNHALVLNNHSERLLALEKNKADKNDLSALGRELAALKKKCANPCPETVKREREIIEPTPDQGAEKSFTAPTDSRPPKSSSSYKSDFSGNHGTTLDQNGFLVYYISDNELKSGESQPTIQPELNKTGGPKFTKEGNLWIYRSQIPYSGDGAMIWCVYIGNHREYDYPMFVPHELAKANKMSSDMHKHAKDIGWEYRTPVKFTRI